MALPQPRGDERGRREGDDVMLQKHQGPGHPASPLLPAGAVGLCRPALDSLLHGNPRGGKQRMDVRVSVHTQAYGCAHARVNVSA